MENTKNDQRGLEKDHKGECQRIQEMMDFQEGRVKNIKSWRQVMLSQNWKMSTIFFGQGHTPEFWEILLMEVLESG